MKNTKTKTWPFLCGGLLLVTYIFFYFIVEQWYTFEEIIQGRFTLSSIFSIYNLFHLIYTIAILLLAATLFFKKKNFLSVIAAVLILVTDSFWLINWLGIRLPNVYVYDKMSAMFITIKFSISIIQSIALIGIILLGTFWAKNVLVKIMCFLPAVLQLFYIIVAIIDIVVDLSSYFKFSFLINDLLFLFSIMLYFFALLFVGIAFQTPLLKSTDVTGATPTIPVAPAHVKPEEKKLMPKSSSAPLEKDVATLRTYKQLLDDGIINEEDFEKKKKELLNL